jgi:diguanylate cyclase (GGDEF)-like protein
MGVSVSLPQETPTRALRGLIEVTRLTRMGGDLHPRLERLAGTIGDSLGYATVVITLYRPEWDDFRIAAVSGREEARRALLGRTRSLRDYQSLLDERFRRSGAYVIPFGSFDWSDMPLQYTPPLEPVDDDPTTWHPEDALLVPLTGTRGQPLGILSVDEPASGRRPTDEELEVLVTVAQHVALAIEDKQEDERLARHRAALEHLLQVSSRLSETLHVETIFQSVCDVIARALGFGKVSIELLDPGAETFSPRASAGWGATGAVASELTATSLAALFDRRFEVEGCYLIPLEEAHARVADSQRAYRSTMNGVGPQAWNRHWLLVPLHDRRGDVQGFIWADDPLDRLLPPREKLQALRLFANQVATALESAERFAEMQFLADHDSLTRLSNRRAFVRRLEEESARAARHGEVFSLVLCDLDDFKNLNDRRGHLAGDEQLIAFGARLAGSVRREDSVYRVGGDEFALILVEAGEDDARRVVDRVIGSVAQQRGALRASFGVAVYTPGSTPEELFRRADSAMYAAKRSGDAVSVAG